jgi:hypothetical protein
MASVASLLLLKPSPSVSKSSNTSSYLAAAFGAQCHDSFSRWILGFMALASNILELNVF